jgi:signal recognition particle subunit SRP9
MTYVKSWEEFEKAAERLYLQDPMKVGFEYEFSLCKIALNSSAYNSE